MDPRRRLRILVPSLLLAGGLAACAGTSPIVDSRPSLAPDSRAGYREIARDQQADAARSPEAALDETLARRAELSDVLRLALARNPRIRQAREAWRAAVARVPQASALPDPSVTVLHYLDGVQTRVGPMEDVFTFTQRIPWPAKLAQAGDVATEGARIAALEYSAAVRNVLVDARISYLEYGYLTRARVLVEQNAAIAERLAGLGADLLSEDRALLIDVLKAQSQLAQLRYDLVTLAELTAAERTRLNALLDRPPEAPLGEPSAAPFPRVTTSIEDLYELAVRHREELLIADRRIEQARAREALAASQFAPDLSIGATYVRVGENRPPIMVPPDSGQDASGIMLGLTIPLWVNRHTAEVREARAERDAAVLGKTATCNETFSALKDAYFKLTNAERLVLLYRDSLVPQAEQVMLSAEERAREDRMRLGDYLETQTVWLNFTLARERALADHDQAIARIERLTGTVLTPAPGKEAER